MVHLYKYKTADIFATYMMNKPLSSLYIDLDCVKHTKTPATVRNIYCNHWSSLNTCVLSI